MFKIIYSIVNDCYLQFQTKNVLINNVCINKLTFDLFYIFCR